MDLDTNRIKSEINRLGDEAGADSIFLEAFTQALLAEPDLAEEFAYYAEKKDFLCKAKVEGYTVIDIMVWQIDHFKAKLDSRIPEMGNNEGRMVLSAFDTMLKMKKDPEEYKQRLQTETGTDYPEKY